MSAYMPTNAGRYVLEMLTQAIEFMLANPEHDGDGVSSREEYSDLYDKLHLTAWERSTDRSDD